VTVEQAAAAARLRREAEQARATARRHLATIRRQRGEALRLRTEIERLRAEVSRLAEESTRRDTISAAVERVQDHVSYVLVREGVALEVIEEATGIAAGQIGRRVEDYARRRGLPPLGEGP
jgi:hypothetical protein